MNIKKKQLFERVLERNKNKIFGICSKYTSDKDHVKDLFQKSPFKFGNQYIRLKEDHQLIHGFIEFV